MTDLLLTEPVTLYGSNISYFTGKMENYFRVRGVSYELRSMQFPAFKKRMEKKVGVMQMPAVILPDGRWMTDTTRMIDWFEQRLPGPGLMPADPLQRFLCLLLEDWADEWWWRPAMHYRWHYAEGARFASWHLAEELLGAVPGPVGLKRLYLQQRQRAGYTTGDGMCADNVVAVEAGVARLLATLQSIFSRRPFLFGDRPSLADIGFSGPFFRHLALDPGAVGNNPATGARSAGVGSAPVEYAFVRLCKRVGQGIPEVIFSLLDDIGSGYLPYLCANTEAVADRKRRFDVQLDGVHYRGARCSRYRVWCLQQLRLHFMVYAGSRAGRGPRHCWRDTGAGSPYGVTSTCHSCQGRRRSCPSERTIKCSQSTSKTIRSICGCTSLQAQQ